MSQPREQPEERPEENTGLVALATAAELIALAMRARLEQRLAWLARGAEDWPEAERAWAADGIGGEEATRRLAGPEGRAWARLVALFGLTAAEADLLSLAVAVAVEPALGPLVARAQGGKSRGGEGRGGESRLPTEPLAKRLFAHPARPICRPTGALARWGLASPVAGAPGVPPGFEADPRVVDWLFGVVALDAPLVLAVDKARHEPVPPEWKVQETATRLAQALRTGASARLVVEGRAGSGRRLFGAAVARALGREAVVADPAPLAADWPDRFMRLQRFAIYADAAVIWAEGAPAWPAKIPLAPVQIICVAEGTAAPALDGAADLRLVLPEPGTASKAAIWARLAPDLAAGAARLAATPGLSLGDLEAASRLAPRTLDEAGAQLRAMARARMQGVGRVVDPQVGWDDLIAAPTLLAQLRRIAFEARARPALMENAETARLFAGAAGLSALFSGPPGVGKSMAAQVIARELGVNLLVVDLGSTTSKYVGETAKNLSAAFAHARAAGAALIFEEADAFFARRTDVKDANDRHANADTSHLLQLMELHDGLVILSSNRRANIDPAFIRRLRHVVEFPRPGPAERRHLWAVMLAALDVAPAPLAATLDRLAETHDLSPAQIKGAALSARYTALAEERLVMASDLEDGATRELAKEGRAAPARAGVTQRRRVPAGGSGHG